MNSKPCHEHPDINQTLERLESYLDAKCNGHPDCRAPHNELTELKWHIETLQALADQRGRLDEKWQPTPEAVNALPDPLRKYIHDLETRSDPAVELRELFMCRNTLRWEQERSDQRGRDLVEAVGMAKSLLADVEDSEFGRAEWDDAAERRLGAITERNPDLFSEESNDGAPTRERRR